MDFLVINFFLWSAMASFLSLGTGLTLFQTNVVQPIQALIGQVLSNFVLGFYGA